MDESRVREAIEEWLQEDAAETYLKASQADAERIRDLLTSRNAHELSHDQIVDLLASTNAVGSKGVAEERIERHSLATLQDRLQELKDIFVSDLPAEEIGTLIRRGSVGYSLATELLQALDPERYWHMRRPVKLGLRALMQPSRSEEIDWSGWNPDTYRAIGEALDTVIEGFRNLGISDANYLIATRFLIANASKIGAESERRYWKIYPKASRNQQREFFEQSFVGLPDHVGCSIEELDLTQPTAIDELPSSKESVSSSLMESYRQFLTQIQAGDRVIVHTGNEILDIGQIEGAYRYNDHVDEYPHRRPIQWSGIGRRAINRLCKDAQEVIKRWDTVVELSEGEFKSLVANLSDRNAWLAVNLEVDDTGFVLAPSKYRNGNSQRLEKIEEGDLIGHIRQSEFVGIAHVQMEWADLRENDGTHGRLAVPVEYHTLQQPISLDNTRAPSLHKRLLKTQSSDAVDVSEGGAIVGSTLGELRTVREQSTEDWPLWADRLLALPVLAACPSFISRHLASKGFNFTDWQIATFFTALQTKGFVILSGISGTGKTKLAQHFAGMMPQPAVGLDWPEGVLRLTVNPYTPKYGKLVIPKRAWGLMDVPDPGEKTEVDILFGDQRQSCRVSHHDYETYNAVELFLRGDMRKWFETTFEIGDTFGLEPESDEGGNLDSIRVLQEADVARQSSEESDNYLFVPVRPDWRDSKSLLGYFNPLTEEYQWTDFLRFVIRARDNYTSDDEDTVAWFVILDEMNLARVEYYFADLLSVLESGRDEEGLTVEPLRPEYPEDATGELPPSEIHLPPNLYVVGTVNVDETTHAFSPKVLDRAFSIRMTEVDFRGYPNLEDSAATMSEGDRRRMLEVFGRQERFATIDKNAVDEFLQRHPEVRSQLQSLNEELREYDLHFAYRVFDEIVAFLDAAEETGMYEDLDGVDGALDAAVLMKVLPKFHGSRGKLEAPLQAIFAWCRNPENPQASVVKENLQELGEDRDVLGLLKPDTTAYPRTATRVAQMLRDLYTEGFTAFS